MTTLYVNCSRGQIKIQQMAFVLVALMIFFSLVFLFYFSIRYSSLQEDVQDLREQEIIETVRKISGTAEFSWTGDGDCTACIDLDKVFVLKNRTSYQGFWKNVAFLQMKRVHPSYGEGKECNRLSYPECDTITLVDEGKGFRAHSAFVALCRYEGSEEYNKCELGKVIIAFEGVENAE